MQLLSPEMQKIKEDGQKGNNRAESMKKSNKQMQILKAKYNMRTGLGLVPMLQLPPLIFFFWTVQEMAYGIDQFPGMTTDGFLWFKNLSEADPYFILPVILASASFLSIHKSPASSQMTGPASKITKYFKYFTFIGIPITSSFPAGIVLNWVVISVFQLMVNSLLYTHKGKKLLGIPQYLPGSILEKFNTVVKTPVIKPKVLQHKPSQNNLN